MRLAFILLVHEIAGHICFQARQLGFVPAKAGARLAVQTIVTCILNLCFDLTQTSQQSPPTRAFLTKAETGFAKKKFDNKGIERGFDSIKI